MSAEFYPPASSRILATPVRFRNPPPHGRDTEFVSALATPGAPSSFHEIIHLMIFHETIHLMIYLAQLSESHLVTYLAQLPESHIMIYLIKLTEYFNVTSWHNTITMQPTRLVTGKP